MSLCERIQRLRPSEFEDVQDAFVDEGIRAFFRGLREKGMLPDEYTPDVVDAAFTARLAAEDGESDPNVWFHGLSLDATQREAVRQSEVISLGHRFHTMLLAVVNADTRDARAVEIAELAAFVDTTLGWTEETLVLLFEQAHRGDHAPVVSTMRDAEGFGEVAVPEMSAMLQERIARALQGTEHTTPSLPSLHIVPSSQE